MNKKEICNLFENKNTNMLDVIFEAREDELANITEEEKKELKEIMSEINKKYVAYINALENIPEAFIETKRKIKDAFIDYCDTIPLKEGVTNKEYYKKGLKDGILLMANCIM